MLPAELAVAMTIFPPTGDEQPTGPLRERSPLWWVVLTLLALALLGYSWYAARATGRAVEPTAAESGRGLPPPTGPTTGPTPRP